MATSTFTALPAASIINGAEVIPCDQSAITVGTNPVALGNFINQTPFQEGASGNGIIDDTLAVQAQANTGYCYLPPGFNFLVTSPIQIPTGGVFIGGGPTSKITGSSVTGGVVQAGINPSSTVKNCTIGNFTIAGTATNAFKSAFTDQGCLFYQMWATGTFTDAFWFDTTFGCTIRDLDTQGATISNSCFSCLGAFSANSCSRWYTANGCPYSFYFEESTTSGGSSGCTFDALCAQQSTIGLYVGKNWSVHTFNAFYAEDVAEPIVLGNSASSFKCWALTFNSPNLIGPNAAVPASAVAHIDFDYCSGIVVNSPYFVWTSGIATAAPLTFSGGGTGAYGIARVNQSGVISSVLLIDPGSGYSGSITVTIGGTGTGASITTSESGGAIQPLVLGSGGTGFAANKLMPIRYNKAYNILVNAPITNSSGSSPPTGQDATWPWVVRNTSAPAAAGVTVTNDIYSVPYSTGTKNAVATLQKVDGGSYLHYVSSLNSSGVVQSLAYTPPVFP